MQYLAYTLFLFGTFLVIISSEDDLFMGFIANMRLARDPTVIVGRVIQPQDNSTLVKTMNCNGTNVSYKINVITKPMRSCYESPNIVYMG